MIEISGKYTKAKIMIDDIDMNCMSQIVEIINHEAFTNNVVIMPDCHYGAGGPIGLTMPIGDKVIPNVVGVDLNCAMLSYNIGKININHVDLDKKIRERIPTGINVNKKGKTILDQGFQELCKKVGVDFDYAIRSLGTLGSGNHFIEIGRSQNTGDIWITIHSGSRNLGKKVCEYWQKRACQKELFDKKEAIKKIKELYPKKELETQILKFKEELKKLRPTPLDFLTGIDRSDYIDDTLICQEYASLNRRTIMEEILSILGNPTIKDEIETIHNYIDTKDNMIRKGAIRSYIGERMLIPFNMRDGILICEGKSNPEWNFSAPHGAGRVLSRSKAKSNLNIEKFEEDMKGIFSTSVCHGTIDEAPDAYKDSSVIEKAIEPTAIILDKIIPIHNLKDISDNKPWKKRRK